MKKRFLSLLLAFALCLGLAVPAMAAESGQSVNWGGHSYLVVDKGMTWSDAQTYCQGLGGHLATITSSEEQQFILDLLVSHSKNFYWLGGTDTRQEGVWEWVTGEAWGYQNWDSNQPDNHSGVDGGAQNYLAFDLRNSHHRWDDVANEGDPSGVWAIENGGFICEWDYLRGSHPEAWTEASAWAINELGRAQEKNLIHEPLYDQDLTKPITRGEFASVAVRLYEEWTGLIVPRGTTPFTDIASHYCQADIEKAYALGITNGISDISFASDTQITREQLATMLCRTYKRITIQGWSLSQDSQFQLDTSGVPFFEDHERISDFARPSVYFMVKHNIMNGVGGNKFAPRSITSQEQAIGYALATREQALVMSLRSLENLKN